MTKFHGDFTKEHPAVVTSDLKVSPQTCYKQESILSVSFGFPNSFRLTDFLPTAVLPTGLSMPAPTRLEIIATAVSHLSSLYKYYITDFQKSQNFCNPLRLFQVAESSSYQKACS